MTTTIMAETCNICAGSLKWTEYTKPQDPEVTEEPSSWGEIIWDKVKTHSIRTTGKRNTNLHT
mgnify:CR=1 FL=1